MKDVVEQLRASYDARSVVPVDADAMIRRATTVGIALRRVRRRRWTAVMSAVAVVAVVVGCVALLSQPDHAVRVVTRATPGTSGELPLATAAEFPDLSRIQKLVIADVRRAGRPELVRAEVVRTTMGALDATTPLVSNRIPRDLPVDVIQLTGTTFSCDCSLVPIKPGRALLYAWSLTTHGVQSFQLRPEPIDLSALGTVYRVPLPRISAPSTTVAADVCTEADLAGPVPSMPAPERITAPIGVTQFGRLDPAAPGAIPRVSPDTAWSALVGQPRRSGRSARLLLGYYSSFAPRMTHVLAWVVRLEHTPTLPHFGPGGCAFTNGWLVLDATTGTGIVDSFGA